MPGAPGGDNTTESPSSKRSSAIVRRVLPLGIAAAVIGVGGYLLLQVFAGDGGGSTSPVAAVESAAKAINGGDATSLATLMAPDELPDLARLTELALDRSESLGATKGRSLGFDVEVDLGELTVEELSDHVAKVSGRPTLDASAQRDTWGAVVEALAGDLDDESLRLDSSDAVIRTDKGRRVDPFVMAIKLDGGWYLSPMLTAAEYVRVVRDLPAPNFAAIEQARTTNPEDAAAAVEEFATAVSTRDVDLLGDVLASSQRRVVVSYRAAINELLRQEGLDARASRPASLAVDNIKTLETKVDGASAVTVSEALLTGSGGRYGGRFSVAWDGRCLRNTLVRSSTPYCLVPTGDAATRLGVDDAPVIVRNEDGGARLDLAASAMRIVFGMAGTIDRTTAATMLGMPELMDGPELKVDGTAKVDFGASSHAVLRVPGSATGLFSLGQTTLGSSKLDVEVFVQRRGEALRHDWPADLASNVVQLRNGNEEHRILLERDCAPFGDWLGSKEADTCAAGATAELGLAPISETGVSFPIIETGTLAPGESKVLAFDVPAGGGWLVASVWKNERVTAVPFTRPETGLRPYTLGPDFKAKATAGRNFILVTNSSSSQGTYTFKVTQQLPGFAGRSSTTVSMPSNSSSAISRTLSLEGGKSVTVLAKPAQADVDVRLQVIDSDGKTVLCNVNAGVAGATERCVLSSKSFDRDVSVRVTEVKAQGGAVELSFQ